MSAKTNGLLEYLSQPAQRKQLTPSLLERVCIRQSKQAPNITMSTMGGKNFWDSLEVNGWKIQRNKISGHYRILDPENHRRAYGSERDLNLCFEYCFMEAQQYQSSNLNERSIVSSGEKGLLEYLSRPDRLALLTPDSLARICQKQSKRALNAPTSTMGGKNFWDSLEVGGWKIQRNKISGHCRVLDPENQRRAYGSENELKFYFECYLSEEQQRRRGNPNKYGIVLSGGGGKGAFEIGVWHYLREQGYDRLINGVSGASVGALNSLLLVNGNLEKAEELWSNVTQTDMLPLNLNMISTFFAFVPFGTLPVMANFAASQVVSHLKPKKDVPLKSGGSGLMSQWGLARLIDQSIDWERVQGSRMTAFCSLSDSALFSKSDDSGDWLDVLRAGEQSEYACWSNMEPQIIKELVLCLGGIARDLRF